jgi:hypothetical protein
MGNEEKSEVAENPLGKKRRARRNRGRRAHLEAQIRGLGSRGGFKPRNLSKLKMRVRSDKHGNAEKVAANLPNRLWQGSRVRNRPVRVGFGLLAQLLLQAVFQFRTDLGNFHARAHQELAAQEIMRTVFIGKFSSHAAVLAILVPAKTAVRNRFRADVLKAAEDRILLGNLKGLSQNLDFDEAFVGAKNLAPAIRGRCLGHM